MAAAKALLNAAGLRCSNNTLLKKSTATEHATSSSSTATEHAISSSPLDLLASTDDVSRLSITGLAMSTSKLQASASEVGYYNGMEKIVALLLWMAQDFQSNIHIDAILIEALEVVIKHVDSLHTASVAKLSKLIDIMMLHKNGSPKDANETLTFMRRLAKIREELRATSSDNATERVESSDNGTERVASSANATERGELNAQQVSLCYRRFARSFLTHDLLPHQKQNQKYRLRNNLSTFQRSFINNLLHKFLGDKKVAFLIWQHGIPSIADMGHATERPGREHATERPGRVTTNRAGSLIEEVDTGAGERQVPPMSSPSSPALLYPPLSREEIFRAHRDSDGKIRKFIPGPFRVLTKEEAEAQSDKIYPMEGDDDNRWNPITKDPDQEWFGGPFVKAIAAEKSLALGMLQSGLDECLQWYSCLANAIVDHQSQEGFDAQVAASSLDEQERQRQQTRRQALQKARDALRRGAALAQQRDDRKRTYDEMNVAEQKDLDDFDTGKTKREKQRSTTQKLKPFRGKLQINECMNRSAAPASSDASGPPEGPREAYVWDPGHQQWRCRVCNGGGGKGTLATEDHLKCDKHLKRIWDEWYLKHSTVPMVL